MFIINVSVLTVGVDGYLNPEVDVLWATLPHHPVHRKLTTLSHIILETESYIYSPISLLKQKVTYTSPCTQKFRYTLPHHY